MFKTVLSSQYDRVLPHIAPSLHSVENRIFHNKEKMQALRRVLETSNFSGSRKLGCTLQFLQTETAKLTHYRSFLFELHSRPALKKLSYQEIIYLELPRHECSLQKAFVKYTIIK